MSYRNVHSDLLVKFRKSKMFFCLIILVLIGIILLLWGACLGEPWLVSTGLAIIPGSIVAGVMGWASRSALLQQLQKSFSLRGDLEASGLRMVADTLTEKEMLSGFRGSVAINENEGNCFVVQTWIPNPESLIRVIKEGLSKGYQFDIVVCNPQSEFIAGRYSRMFGETPPEDVPQEARHSISRVARSFPNALKEGKIRVYQHNQSNGMCIYKLGAFAWLSFYMDRESAILGPQLCVDANSSNLLYNAAFNHYRSLIEGIHPMRSEDVLNQKIELKQE